MEPRTLDYALLECYSIERLAFPSHTALLRGLDFLAQAFQLILVITEGLNRLMQAKITATVTDLLSDKAMEKFQLCQVSTHASGITSMGCQTMPPLITKKLLHSSLDNQPHM